MAPAVVRKRLTSLSTSTSCPARDAFARSSNSTSNPVMRPLRASLLAVIAGSRSFSADSLFVLHPERGSDFSDVAAEPYADFGSGMSCSCARVGVATGRAAVPLENARAPKKTPPARAHRMPFCLRRRRARLNDAGLVCEDDGLHAVAQAQLHQHVRD